MIEVKTRSEEAWGPLSSSQCPDKEFEKLMVSANSLSDAKAFIKRQKKLKKYKVAFKRILSTEMFIVEAENDYDVSSAARKYFDENMMQIGFVRAKENGYDSFSFVKVR